MRMKYRYDITMHEFSILSSDNRMVRSFRRLVIPLIAVFCLQTPLATAQSDIPSLGDTARGELTPVAEYQLGKEIMVQVRSDPAYVNDPVLTEYLTNLGNRLVSADPQIRGELANDFSFFAIRDATARTRLPCRAGLSGCIPGCCWPHKVNRNSLRSCHMKSATFRSGISPGC